MRGSSSVPNPLKDKLLNGTTRTQKTKRRPPILWEENERFQRAWALILVRGLALAAGACAVFLFATRDWQGLWMLALVVGAIVAGCTAWSVVVIGGMAAVRLGMWIRRNLRLGQ